MFSSKTPTENELKKVFTVRAKFGKYDPLHFSKRALLKKEFFKVYFCIIFILIKFLFRIPIPLCWIWKKLVRKTKFLLSKSRILTNI